jgi:putative flippase GtrA
MRPLPNTTQVFAFGVVGTVAAAAHFTIVSLIVPFGVPPLAANVVGFLGAFGLSFFGHHYWSFPAKNREKRRAALRFFIVACSSFALNETLYWLLLLTGLGYRIALLIVLMTVAIVTLVFSKHWAFADA